MENPAAASGVVMDPLALARLHAHGGAGLVTHMVELVLATAEERIRAVRLGLQTGDAQAIARAAHSLKTSCGIVGAQTVAELSAALEQGAASRDEQAIPPLVADLERAYHATREILLQELRQLEP
jgi:histidine phosphotransfer protein HptB